MSYNRSSTTVAMSADELGSYQSLNTLAVVSFLLGLLSLLSFAPFQLFLWVLPPTAVLTGFLALRQIASAPEVWTGKRLAHAGIGIALASALSAISINFYSNILIRKYGRALAERFVEKIKEGEIESAFWLTVPREARQNLADKSIQQIPEQLLEKYTSFRTEAVEFTRSLAQADSTFEFDTIEGIVAEHGLGSALVVYKLHSPSRGDHHALFVAAGWRSQNTQEMNWFISEYKFDYAPNSHMAETSGHGHVH